MVQLNLRWTPEGTVVERLVDGKTVASGTCSSIDDAVEEGIRIELADMDRADRFPGMTDRQIETEEWARAIERRLALKGWS